MRGRYHRSHRGRRGRQNKKRTGNVFSVLVRQPLCDKSLSGCGSVCRHTNDNLKAVIHADLDLAILNRSGKGGSIFVISLAPFSLRGRQLCPEFRVRHTKPLRPAEAPGSCRPYPPPHIIVHPGHVSPDIRVTGGMRATTGRGGCSCVERGEEDS